MHSLIRSPKDFCAGLIYLAIGLGAIYHRPGVADGHGVEDGPGLFPDRAGLAALAHRRSSRWSARSCSKASRFPRSPGSRSLLITGATVVFGLLVRGAGLVIALPVFMIMTAYASVKFPLGADARRWPRSRRSCARSCS